MAAAAATATAELVAAALELPSRFLHTFNSVSREISCSLFVVASRFEAAVGVVEAAEAADAVDTVEG